MKILIDASAIKNTITGAGKYASCLLRALSQLDNANQYTILLNTSIPGNHPVFDTLDNRNFSLKRIDIPAIGPKRQLIFLRKIRNRIQYDVFHCLHSNFPLAVSRNGVVTIHDLKFILFPQFFGRYHKVKQLYLRAIFSHALYSCNQVITDSASTKSDLLRVFKPDKQLSKKIHVVHLASCMPDICCPDDIFQHFRLKHDIPGDYFLYVGEQRPHKNIEGLIEGYRLFISKNQSADVPLVLAGVRHSSANIPNDKHKMDSRCKLVFTGPVDDRLLSGLYANALALAFTSFYEGFGLPIIEAMAYGIPVITSNVSSMPEIAGDAALLVDPQNKGSIAQALSSIYNNKSLRDHLKVKGIKRAAQFSWDKTAEKTLSVYQKAL